MKIGILALFCIISLGCSESSGQNDTDLGKELFTYRSLGKKEALLQVLDSADFSYDNREKFSVSSFKIKREQFPTVTGYLFEPTGEATGNGIIYLHWLGGVKGVDKGIEEFFIEAASMAANGYTCILPEGFFPWWGSPRGDERDCDALKKQIIITRLSLDLLQQQRGFLKNKNQCIGVVGHDYGGMHGVLLAAADTRIRFVAAMTIVPGYWEWNRFRTTIDGDELDKYKELLRPYDPETHLKTMKIPILLQFGNMDKTMGKEERENFLKNIPPHAEIQIFNFGHNLNKYESATINRADWIIDQFNSL